MNTIIKKIFILLFAFAFVGTNLSEAVAANSDDNSSSVVGSSSVPSYDYMESQTKGTGASMNSSLGVAQQRINSLYANDAEWGDDPFNEKEHFAPGGNVGAPVGDATLPIVLSILLLYFLFRTVSTSKRKNDL